MKDKRKLLFVVVAILILVTVILGASYTYSYFTATSQDVGSIAGTTYSPSIKINVQEVTNLNSKLVPVEQERLSEVINHNPKCFEDNGNEVCDIYRITVMNEGSNSLYTYIQVNLLGDNLPNLKWREITNTTTLKDNVLANGIGFGILVENGKIDAHSTNTYYIMVYVNETGNVQNDSGTYHGVVTLYSSTMEFNPVPANELITNLYNSADKTIISNNNINYNTAPSVSLMNDRLGGITQSLDGGNIRYYGLNPNNYIDIGEVYPEGTVKKVWGEIFSEDTFSSASDCSDYVNTYFSCDSYSEIGFDSVEECETMFPELLTEEFGVSDPAEFNTKYCVEEDLSGQPVLWRIIGLFDNKVKVMREKSIGIYSWDNKDISTGAQTDNGKNDWTDARLMKLLNPGYVTEEIGGSLYYNGGTGSCYSGVSNATKNCDFSTILFDDNVKNKISDTVWFLGGNGDDSSVDGIYRAERESNVYPGHASTWTGKIALPYLSDYGYSGDISNCNISFNYCDSWMEKNFDKNDFWLLTPNRFSSYSAYQVYYGVGETSVSNDGTEVFPALYLKPDVVVIFGNGTKNDPYVLNK